MTATATAHATATVESEVARIRALVKERRFAEGVAAATALLCQVPENRDVLYLLALGQRQLTRTADALATLEQLERFHPGYSRLYQERGHCYVAMKDAPQAIQAFLRAVAINPALPASWGMLEGLYRMCGDADNSGKAAAHVAKLKTLPQEVITATGLFSDGDLVAAEKMIRAFLLAHGDHIEAMRLLARIGAALEVFDDAELLLGAVLERVPDYSAARYDYASVLLGRHKYSQALIELDKLLGVDPANRQYRTLRATAVVGLGDHLRAITLYEDLLRDAPPQSPHAAELHLSIAHSLKTLGRQSDAIAEYHAATRERADFGDAYWSLANLKTYRFMDAELESMRAAEALPATGLVDRYHLCFALGKAFEDRGEYAESWDYYERGNALKRAESRYRPEVIELNTANQKLVCTRKFFEQRLGFGVASTAPIFVLGLPRSGSTLIEQILASHSAVEGTQELAEIPRYVLELQGRERDFESPRYPAVLAQVPAAQFVRFAERYLEDTRVYRTGKPRFIDKMPNNFRHIGFIHLMFPNAKIIDARREPMACCFGNLKQQFARGQEFTYSIEDIARYYRTYLELMEHWDTVLPGRVLRVHHEDVVDDLERSVRRILDFCELPFEPACVEYHRTERSVRTASSEQVRRPIFREGLDQWRRFETWLGPLRDALGDALVRYRR
ncbi:MAG TPA: sulfotransferase [Steroidobacteraceae bacterium]|nr:sulfotransferase [Steroidobacteraceae bacterium]